jgi:hypothetical protein
MPEQIPNLGKRTVIPNASYQAGSMHTFIFGEHWRQVWSSPVEVPVLDMQTFAGGLKPLEKGGGFQTQSLKLKGQNGVVYKFRSIDKDPLKMVPEDLQKSIVADILQDQVSSYYPLSTQLVKPFTRALGVLYSEAQICVLPEDSLVLGRFLDEFGGKLGTIEVHPDEHENEALSFQGAQKVVGTHKMYGIVEDDNDEFIDQKAYLKARLLDIFLGDWDRHYDQWRWAGFKQGKKRIWKPIPRDRDQAFARLAGVFPWVITQVVPQMNSFSGSYPSIWFLTWSGRRVDQKCLTQLDRETWHTVAKNVQNTLSDSLIETAVASLPVSAKNQKSKWLQTALKQRRDHLVEAAMEMYSIYAAFPNIEASNDDDFAQIERHSNGSLTVKLYKMDKDEMEKKGKPWYKRRFLPGETHEIRLYLLDDDDKAVVSGSANESIKIRIIGGNGEDQLYDKSMVYCCGVFSNSKTLFYDSDSDTFVKQGPNSTFSDQKVLIPPDPVEKYERSARDFGNEWWYSVDNLYASYSSDFGVLLGHGMRYEHYAFRQSPYAFKMGLKGGYAFGSEVYELEYTSDFRNLVPGASIELEAKTSGLELLNFYGFGNSTTINDSQFDDDFYETQVQKTTISARLTIPFYSHSLVYLGSEIKHLDMPLLSDQDSDSDDQSFINFSRPYGTRQNQNISLIAGFSVDTRQKTQLSRSQDAHLSFRWQSSSSPATRSSACSGSYLTMEGRYVLNALKNRTDFSKLRLEMGSYLPLPFSLSRLALRFGGEKIWGAYPFFEAAFLGGKETLRGFPSQRYAGDAEVHAGAEMRLFLKKFNFLVPVYFGPLLFSETGRVFYSGDTNDQNWHTSLGGGIWMSFIEPVFTVSLSVGRTVSEPGNQNETAVYLTSGFTF